MRSTGFGAEASSIVRVETVHFSIQLVAQLPDLQFSPQLHIVLDIVY